ncbi:hypothetical protein V2G26_008624 [Clonostachys chloroleuca]
MKFGEQLEQQSVPQWSLHNLDYNSLKHEIKAHTTRDQAAAIAIPGHQDSALSKFEDGLFRELCRQHDRVDLFVSSKADEVSRRLDHLSGAIQRLIRKHSDDSAPTDSIKYHRRLIKYERELYQCGDDIHALSRFGNAQIVAFRKIIKKYKKWTGSTTLGARFNETILNHPKSFTRRDNTPLRFKYQEILSTLQRAYPNLDEFSSPSTIGDTRSRRGSAAAQQPQTQFEPLPPPRYPKNLPKAQLYGIGTSTTTEAKLEPLTMNTLFISTHTRLPRSLASIIYKLLCRSPSKKLSNYSTGGKTTSGRLFSRTLDPQPVVMGP